MTVLASTGPGYNEGEYVNHLGDIGSVDHNEATMWNSDGSIEWQGSASGGSDITAINASGAAVGNSFGVDGQALYWSPDGTETALDPPTGFTSSAVYG
jgi:hypothetical protein